MKISTDVLLERVEAIGAIDGIDAAQLSGDEAVAWAARVAQVRHASDAILAVLAQRIDELSAATAGPQRYARSKGFAGANGLLSRAAEMGASDVGKLIGLGRALAEAEVGASQRGELGVGAGDGSSNGEASNGEVPTDEAREAVPGAYLAAAIRDGSLAPEKATIMRKTLDDMTIDTIEVERSLVDRARRRSLPDVRRMCFEELARLDEDGLRERERRNRAARSLRFFDEPDGMVTIHGKLDVATAAPVRAWLDARVRRDLALQRDLSDDERLEAGQLCADALAVMADHCLGCDEPTLGVKTTMVVRVDEADLNSGVGVGRCDSSAGPISVSVLRQMAVDAQILPAVMGGPSVPLDFGRARRRFTPMQKLAIAERDRGCARCGAPVAYCDVHHIREWSLGGPTDLENAVLLCVGCHHRVHDYGWGIEIDDDGVWFIPPASVDPRRRRQPSCATRLAV